MSNNSELASGGNPYSAHLDKPSNAKQAQRPANGNTASPLDGWITRKVVGKQVATAMDGPTNPFTGRAHSTRYFEILKQRKNLPVHQQMTEFLEIFSRSQFTVMVGETGSGKTTQYAQIPLIHLPRLAIRLADSRSSLAPNNHRFFSRRKKII
jgi:pre-mRNA-splicing factor ATP-dependent RNA helicase DHX15/PRP43